MIFSTDTKEFRAALQMVGRAIPAKSPWPIMTSVKIATNDNRISLIGSDIDITLETEISAAVDTEGAFCLPFATLMQFVRSAGAETCKVEVKDFKAKISAGRNRVTLSAEDIADYPTIAPAEGGLTEFDPTSFCAALKFCLSASEDSEVRYHISGVNFSQNGDDVHMWGTDGVSAHFARIAAPNSMEGGGTLPMAACTVATSIGEKAENLQFMICDVGWHIATPTARAWGKVIDAAYPNMDTVVNQFSSWAEVASIDKDEMSDAIGIATCGAEADSTKSRNIIVRASNGQSIVMRGHRTIGGVVHAGRAELELPAKGEFMGGVSAKYLSAAIAGIGSDTVLVESGSSEKLDRRALRISDARSSAALSMSATVLAMRLSESEMVDV